jgi:hypothetical protein
MEVNKQQKNWFGRNWKWAIPSLGCLIIIVFAIFLAGAMVVKVTDLFKESVPYTDGMAALKNNEFVIEEIGEPIEPSGMFQGNVSYSDDGGNADIKVPVKGPKGEATLLVIGEKVNGKWVYLKMEVTLSDTDKKIDLLKKDVLIDL